jgi:hypothetical protein
LSKQKGKRGKREGKEGKREGEQLGVTSGSTDEETLK